MTTSSAEEEARTAAMMLAKLIRENGLVMVEPGKGKPAAATMPVQAPAPAPPPARKVDSRPRRNPQAPPKPAPKATPREAPKEPPPSRQKSPHDVPGPDVWRRAAPDGSRAPERNAGGPVRSPLVIRSRFDGKCLYCGKRWKAGTEVYWARGVGAVCVGNVICTEYLQMEYADAVERKAG